MAYRTPRWLLPAVLLLVLAGAPPTARAADAPTVMVDWPSDGALVSPSLAATGWAVGPAGENGTGVDAVRAYLNGPAGDSVPLGRVTYGLSRPDVALALREARYGPSGWRLEAELPPGPHTLFVYAHLAGQPEDEGWVGPVQVAVRVDGGAGPGPV